MRLGEILSDAVAQICFVGKGVCGFAFGTSPQRFFDKSSRGSASHDESLLRTSGFAFELTQTSVGKGIDAGGQGHGRLV